MEEKNSIDQLFRKGVQQDFPMDQNLWNAVEKDLPNGSQGKPGLWIFNLNGLALLAILSISMSLHSDSSIASVALESKTNAPLAENREQVNPASETASPKPQRSTEKIQLQSISPSIEVAKAVPKREERATSELEQTADKGSSTTAPIERQNFVSQASSLSVSNSKEAQEEIQWSAKPKLYGPLEPMQEQGHLYVSLEQTAYPKSKDQIWKAKQKRSYYYEFSLSQSLQAEKSISGLESNVQAYRQDKEKVHSARNLGLQIFSDWSIFQFGLGLNVSQYKERLQYALDEEGIGYDVVYDTNYRVVNGNYTNNGVPVLLIEQEINSREVEKDILLNRKLRLENTYHRLQIPISLGIHKNFGPIYANIRNSILLQYAYAQRGAYINKELNKVRDFEQNENFNAFVLGNRIEGSLGYNLNEGIIVGARYFQEGDLSSFTSEYSSKFKQSGIGLWILWKPIR